MLLLAAPGARAAEPEPAPPPASLERLRPVIGEERTDLVLDGDTLLDIAFRNRLGFQALSRLNPDVDTWIPKPGSVVRLPSRIVLPDVEYAGLVINVPEMRLFDFTAAGGPEVISVAVGDADDPTPIGEFRIGEKRVDPAWTVPESIRAEKPHLPDVMPPGPDNPLGSRWMRIGKSSYGIHGTNIRWSIGRQATHGCVRLYEDQMRRLFDRTPEGTRLQIVYQPFKWGRDGSRILLEAHPDVYGRIPDPLSAALVPVREMGLLHSVDVERVWHVIEASSGAPVVVGRLPPGLEP
jgi:L,D-transpeptidase ErfK/SrfK